jgi:two-component system, cell cycle sensor histidine kinase and response regulator CckA
MKYNIIDLIDIKKIDSLLQGFSDMTNITTALGDVDGNILTRAAWRSLCIDFHRIHPESRENCRISDSVLSQNLKLGRKHSIYKCLNGLIDIAVPVYVEETHIANLYLGQLFFEKPHKEFFIRQAEKYGFDKDSYLAALEEIPIVTEQEMQNAINYLLNVTEILSEMGLKRIQEKSLQSIVSRSEKKYRTYLKFAPTGYYVLNRAGRCTDVNPAMSKITGYSIEELLGMRLSGIIVEEDKEKLGSMYKRIQERGNIETEFGFIRKDGVIGYCAVNAIKISDDQFVGLVHDLTDRRKEEEELSVRQKLLERITNNIPKTYISIIEKDYTVSFSAGKEFEARNLDPASFTGLSIDQIFGDQVNKVRSYYALAFTGEETGFSLYIDDQYQEYSVVPLFGLDNNISQILVVVKDVTERKKVELRLQQLEKLESIGNLAGGIAHDFNNLLGGLFGFIEMASVKNQNPIVEDYLSQALSAFERARDLTHQLLTFSKGGEPKLQTHSIREIITKNILFNLSGSSAASEFNLAEDLWFCDIDENQIGQVLDNLIINAKQAMQPGGKILVTAANTRLSTGDIAELDPGSYIHIAIQDYGSGIDPTIMNRIFEPFFTTKEKDKGKGLGLATCFSIMRKHNGTITVESTLGEGSVFHLYLPKSVMTAAVPDSKTDSQIHSGSGVVLVMDDEISILHLAETMFNRLGYTVVTAINGSEALSICKDLLSQNSSIKAALLDLTVPGELGGKEIVSELHDKYPNVVVFATSGYSNDPIIANPQDFGFVDSLQKPYKFKELSDMLSRHFPDSIVQQGLDK